MPGYINKQIVNERGQVQVVEGTLAERVRLQIKNDRKKDLENRETLDPLFNQDGS